MTDSKIAVYWERFAIYVCSLLLGLCGYLYLEQKDRVAALEKSVQTMQIDKVSRQELKEMEDRLINQMSGLKGDIIYHINLLRDNNNKK